MIKKLFLVIAIVSINCVALSATSEIVQIKPNEAEFLEIKSSQDINVEEAKIFKSDNENYNDLSLYKNGSSSNILIVGDRFLHEKGVDDLDCKVYRTSGTQVAWGGMKNSGEEIRIEADDFSLKWTPTKSYTLNENQSINTLNGKVVESNPCNKNNKQNNNNNTIQLRDEDYFCNCPLFELNVPSLFFDNRIEYSFKTTANTFEVEYWVEHYNSSIARNPNNSSSLSTKYFTPNIPGIYIINARLHTSECTSKVSKKVFFHTEFEEENNILNSSIEVLNKDEIKDGLADEIKYSIYRGDTLKRVVKFFSGTKELTSFEIDRFTSASGSINIPSSYDNIKVEGLGISKKINISVVEPNTQSSNTKSQFDEDKFSDRAMNFEINDIKQKGNTLNFSYNITHKGDIICRVVLRRTSMSSNYTSVSSKGENFGSLKLKTKEIPKDKEDNLELFCQYKKIDLLTFNSKREILNLNLNLTQNNNVSISEEESLLLSSNDQKQKELLSENVELKQYSLYAFIVVCVLSIIGGLIFWKM